MKRTFKQVALLAPQKPSTTKRRLFESSFTARSLIVAHASSVTGLLSFLYSSEVHQTLSALKASLTINLSLGERPVYCSACFEARRKAQA